MVRLVLFDIDGTLIRTGGAGVKAFARVFETEFKVPRATEKLNFSGRTDASLLREFFNGNNFNHTPENIERFRDRYFFWLAHLLEVCQGATCPGVWEMILAMKSLPNPPVMGLLTGNFQLGAELKLRHYHLWDEFEIGAFADDHEDRNELARIAKQRGSRLLGQPLKGEEILVIGDTPLDIACGRAIEAKILAVGTGAHSVEQLEAHKPTWAVESLYHAKVEEICG